MKGVSDTADRREKRAPPETLCQSAERWGIEPAAASSRRAAPPDAAARITAKRAFFGLRLRTRMMAQAKGMTMAQKMASADQVITAEETPTAAPAAASALRGMTDSRSKPRR